MFHFHKPYLIDRHFQLQSSLHRLENGTPLCLVWLGHILEDDLSAPHVLILHQLVGVSTLFLRVGREQLGEARQRDVVTGAVRVLV